MTEPPKGPGTPYRRRNVAKMLARLNPKSLTMFGGPRGTGTGETALDIAGALGAAGQAGAPQRLAVLSLCLRWWPGVFEGPAAVVAYRSVERNYEVDAITRERDLEPTLDDWTGLSRRRAERQTVTHTYTERMPIERPSETAAFQSIANLIATRLEDRISRDRSRAEEELGEHLWASIRNEAPPRRQRPRQFDAPALPEELYARVMAQTFQQRWARAVINEYRHPNQCQACKGYGEQMKISRVDGRIKADVESCELCIGQGVLPWSKKRRAAQLEIGEHPFRGLLNTHHEGALALLRELEYRGAKALLKRLGVDD